MDTQGGKYLPSCLMLSAELMVPRNSALRRPQTHDDEDDVQHHHQQASVIVRARTLCCNEANKQDGTASGRGMFYNPTCCVRHNPLSDECREPSSILRLCLTKLFGLTKTELHTNNMSQSETWFYKHASRGSRGLRRVVTWGNLAGSTWPEFHIFGGQKHMQILPN